MTPLRPADDPENAVTASPGAPTPAARLQGSARDARVWLLFVVVHAWQTYLALGPQAPAYTDVDLYRWWVQTGLDFGQWPVLDGPWVYPAGALLPVLVPAVVSTTSTAAYVAGWCAFVTLLDAVAVALLLRHRAGHAAAVWWLAFLLLLGPAVLKVRFGVDEVVTTLLLNFVMLLFVSMLLEGILKDPTGLGWPQSQKLVADARLPRIVTGRRLHYGFVLAIVAAVSVWFVMKKTTLGYEMRAVGHNPAAASFAGIPVNTVLMKTALLSGGLAALAGFTEVAGLKGNLTLDLSPGYGYSGIVVAMLAMLNPIGVVASAIFVAGIFVGADAMSRAAGVPSYIANVMVATALLTMVTAIMLTRFKVRWK